MKKSSMALLIASFFFTVTHAETNQSMTTFPTTPKQMQTSAERNKAASEAFLTSNKKKTGVVTLPSGLQYRIIKEGSGVKPTSTDKVTVNYAGTYVDGTVFDSSKEGQPITFELNGVIPGWVEALQLMKTGSIWEIYLPPELAYGEQGAPPVIAPNQALIFRIELLDVKK